MLFSWSWVDICFTCICMGARAALSPPILPTWSSSFPNLFHFKIIFSEILIVSNSIKIHLKRKIKKGKKDQFDGSNSPRSPYPVRIRRQFVFMCYISFFTDGIAVHKGFPPTFSSLFVCHSGFISKVPSYLLWRMYFTEFVLLNAAGNPQRKTIHRWAIFDKMPGYTMQISIRFAGECERESLFNFSLSPSSSFCHYTKCIIEFNSTQWTTNSKKNIVKLLGGAANTISLLLLLLFLYLHRQKLLC